MMNLNFKVICFWVSCFEIPALLALLFWLGFSHGPPPRPWTEAFFRIEGQSVATKAAQAVAAAVATGMPSVPQPVSETAPVAAAFVGTSVAWFKEMVSDGGWV